MGSHCLEAMPPRRRDVSATPDTTRPKRHHRLTRAGGRFGVLAALVGVTVVVPVSQTALADSGIASPFEARVALPSTLDALTATPPSQQPPASLVSAAGTETKVDLAKVSRSVWRSPLEGCTGERPADAGQFQNGLLPASALCTLFDGHTQMRADAAVNLAELNEAYVARFGADLCLSSGYRTLAQQRSVKAEKGGLAATPGKSNHGWGLAIDFCSKETTGERWTWLNENAPLYDFENPSWARDGGSGPHERWHWEYLKGVIEDGEYYG